MSFMSSGPRASGPPHERAGGPRSEDAQRELPMAIANPPQSDRPPLRPRRLLWRLLWPARSAAGARRTARVPWIPIAIISAIVVMALFAPLLAPYSPIDQTLRDKLLPPAWLAGGSDKYWLGTDA